MQKFDFIYDEKASFEERIKFIIKNMTLEEKLNSMTTGIPAIERFGFNDFFCGGEAAHGVQARHDQSFDKGDPEFTTLFPCPIGMSATWDRDLIRLAGLIVGLEARTLYNEKNYGSLCMWAPTIDMERDPRWGRNEEAYGEDPFLTGHMAGSYINGMSGRNQINNLKEYVSQADNEAGKESAHNSESSNRDFLDMALKLLENGDFDEKYLFIGATLKHFYANNNEEGRNFTSSDIPEDDKWEYYLEAFRQVCKNSPVEGVMAAYNAINGVPCAINPELDEVLKKCYGVSHVVTDGGGMQPIVNAHRYFKKHSETVEAGLHNGTDMFTDDRDVVRESVREALNEGRITEADLDGSLFRHYMTMFRLGVPDKKFTYFNKKIVNHNFSRNISRICQQEASVLLKNEGGLPVKLNKKSSDESIVVAGPLMDLKCIDWYSGVTDQYISVSEGICNAVSNVCDVILNDGMPIVRIKAGDKYLAVNDKKEICKVDSGKAGLFKLMLWDDEKITIISMDNNKYLTVNDPDAETVNSTEVEKPDKICANANQAFGWYVREIFHLCDKDGKAISFNDETAGEFWKHPEVFGLMDWNKTIIDIGKIEFETVKEPFEDLTAAGTATAETTVFAVMGTHPLINCKEERDRNTIELPPFERALVKKLTDTYASVNLILTSNYPLGIVPEYNNEKIKSIIWTATGSEELGNGLADVIFGKTSPSGKLNMTWYRSDADITDIMDYRIRQSNRTYMHFDKMPLFPFGYGLSYTDFKYEDLQTEIVSANEYNKKKISAGSETDNETYTNYNKKEFETYRLNHYAEAPSDKRYVKVSFKVTNTGEMKADAVAEIFASLKNDDKNAFIKKLVQFERVKNLKPGETREVSLVVDLDDIRLYNKETKKNECVDVSDLKFEVV